MITTNGGSSPTGSSSPDSKENVWKMCVAAIPTWSGIITPDSMTVNRLLGNSSLTLAVSVNDKSLMERGIGVDKVFLRVYPQHSANLVNRKKEQTVFAYISGTEHGIKMYYQCPEYRIEEMIDGEKLNIFELGNKYIMRRIAQMLCTCHRDPHISDIISQFDPKTPFAVRFIEDWYAQFCQSFSQYMKSPDNNTEHTRILERLEYMTTPRFREEYEGLLRKLDGSEVVNSHGDVHAMNVMQMRGEKDRLLLIDWEYCTFNYRAIDIAMLWVETGIDYTYQAFPLFKYYEFNRWDEEELGRFARFYLEKEAEIKGIKDVAGYVSNELPKLMAEIKVAEPLVSAMWAVWSVLKIDWKGRDGEKDWRLAYALFRFELYEKTRDAAANKV